jgi:hypothetical protein
MLKVVILFDSHTIYTIFAYKYKIYHLNDQEYLEENI